MEADLDDLHVGAEEEEVGSGGNPVVVDVVAPGPTLPHLGALQTICFHHLNTDIRMQPLDNVNSSRESLTK